MDTPLLSALLDHIRLGPAPFHMPGHKGRMEALEALASPAALDVTELPDTGDLYAGGDAIAQAEGLWAAAWGFPCCQFLTCGSTQGVHAALLLAARRGPGALVDRACHRSVYNALALCRLSPRYTLRTQDLPLSPAQVDRDLSAAEAQGEPISTVCITSPTYYGVLSDVPAIAGVAHAHGAVLVVDAAHGCHLPFLGENPFLGADLVVTSAHKTLPVYGQGALLFSGGAYGPRDLRWAAGVMGTSSPSYPVMASMDWARAWAESAGGQAALRGAAETAALFRQEFSALRGEGLDPLRLTLTVDALVHDGFQVKDRLEGVGVFPELGDRDHVVFLCGGQNSQEDWRRLWAALKELEEDWRGLFGRPLDTPAPPAPEVVAAPADALTAPRTTLRLAEAVGAVAAQQVAPYPPGVPVIAPGERITKKCLAYLREVGYNVHSEVDILRP